MKFFSLTLLFFFTLVSCASVSSGARTGSSSKNASVPKSNKVRSEAGLNIPAWGVAIDAVYDKRLDNLIPGYKMMNVVLTNRSPSTIYLDPRRDKWIIRDSVGKSHSAINHLRFTDEKIWLALPVGLKDQLEYPHAVRTGNSTKIDLFFPAGTELAGFREISWRSDHFKQVFDVYTAMEKNLDWDPKSEKTPTETPAVRQSIEKYDNPPPGQETGALDLSSAAGEEADRENRPGYEAPFGDLPADPVPTAQTTRTKRIEESPPPFDPRLDDVTTIPMD